MTADGKIPVLSGGPAGTGSAGGAVTGCGVWPLYVGLFLALLKFFIVLVARAPLDSARTSAVLHGVQRTFASTPPPLGEALFVAGRSALAELGGDLAGIIRIAREMRVRLDTLGLFTDGTAALRPEIAPMLDRIVAALGYPPQGLRLETAFTIGRPAPAQAAGSDGGGDSLAVARCAAVARALVARGAVPAAIATGVGSGPPEGAAFAFRFRPDGRTPAAAPGAALR
ncbi:MAG: hypothetical protein U1E38_03430 [Rhodospirillales bacterium]